MANTFWQSVFVRPPNRLVLRKTAAAKRDDIDTRHPLLGRIQSDVGPMPALLQMLLAYRGCAEASRRCGVLGYAEFVEKLTRSFSTGDGGV